MRADELQVELPPRPSSAADARRFVARALRGAARRDREIGILLTSELVTNSLLYAQGRIHVQVETLPGAYRVVVHDSSERPVQPRMVGPNATSGRGLALVEQLASAWGVDIVEGSGKSVWFEVPRPA